MTQRQLALSFEQRQELKHTRDHDARPYLRERAAALLKIADGASVHWVARFGLLKPHKPDTVYRWLNAYQDDPHLHPRPACRRAFSPSGCRARRAGGAVAPHPGK